MNRVLVGCLFFFCGCSSRNQQIQLIYNERHEVLKIFNNISIFKAGRSKSIYLYSYDLNGNRNEYFFEYDSILHLFRNEIRFRPDLNLDIQVGENDKLIRRLKYYLLKMNSLNIREISSDFKPLGISIKIYGKDGFVMIYSESPAKITNPQWLDYLNKLKKIDDHWFYDLNE